MSAYKNSKIYEILKKDINNAMLSHCYILHGQNEDVLLEFSKSVAKHVLCTNSLENNKPCNNCAVCNNIENQIYSDVIIYPKDSKTIKTSDANDIVLQSYVKPLESEYKFFILNNFDTATIPAQNKLLKTIEEPSKNVIFVISTTNIFGVLDTIKSRSKVVYETSAINNLNALKKEKLQELTLNAMYNMKKSSDVLQTAFNITNSVQDLEVFIENLQEFVLDIVRFKNGINENNLSNQNKIYAIQELSDELSFNGLLHILHASQQLVNQLRANTNKSLALEAFLLKVLEIKYKCKINEL